MAGRYDTYIIEWQCLKPEVYNETHGFLEWTGVNPNNVIQEFLKSNPDYKVVSIKIKEE